MLLVEPTTNVAVQLFAVGSEVVGLIVIFESVSETHVLLPHLIVRLAIAFESHTFPPSVKPVFVVFPAEPIPVSSRFGFALSK